ncbi:hypothetical protein WP50_01585, partial [Lactiplantibacillus plantarum]
MGDWGYFATPEAQCQGAFTFNYSLELTDGSEAQRIASYQRAQGMQTPFSNQQTWQHTGTLEADDQYLTLATPERSPITGAIQDGTDCRNPRCLSLIH